MTDPYLTPLLSHTPSTQDELEGLLPDVLAALIMEDIDIEETVSWIMESVEGLME